MKKTRRQFTPQEKGKILRLHLPEQKPVSNNRLNLMRTGTKREKNVYVPNKFSFGPSQENEGRKKTLLEQKEVA